MTDSQQNLDGDGASAKDSEALSAELETLTPSDVGLILETVFGRRKSRTYNSFAYRERRMRRFGRKPSDYGKILDAQGGYCAICNAQLNDSIAVIDHDHKTMRFRALLCRKCNSGLGFFNDDPRLMRRAAQYVANHRGRFWRTFLKALPDELVTGISRAVRKARQ